MDVKFREIKRKTIAFLFSIIPIAVGYTENGLELDSNGFFKVQQSALQWFRQPSPIPENQVCTRNIAILVGGWTNPFEKYARQIGSFPKKGVNIKICSNHHLV